MNDYKNLLKLLFEKIERMRTETPSAGTRFRLMGLTADIWEVAETLQKNVTACVSKEAVLDADIDVNYAELSEQVLAVYHGDVPHDTWGLNCLLEVKKGGGGGQNRSKWVPVPVNKSVSSVSFCSQKRFEGMMVYFIR